jgi:delta-aminolevulinic acid dehydratase/porphobilinogen synthase
MKRLHDYTIMQIFLEEKKEMESDLIAPQVVTTTGDQMNRAICAYPGIVLVNAGQLLLERNRKHSHMGLPFVVVGWMLVCFALSVESPFFQNCEGL